MYYIIANYIIIKQIYIQTAEPMLISELEV